MTKNKRNRCILGVHRFLSFRIISSADRLRSISFSNKYAVSIQIGSPRLLFLDFGHSNAPGFNFVFSHLEKKSLFCVGDRALLQPVLFTYHFLFRCFFKPRLLT